MEGYHDASGNLTKLHEPSVTTPVAQTIEHVYAYDSRGNRTKETGPERQVTAW